jgi:predicted regulator of Ras-like GTPase activity (Roadblock/LC7/MglB family)
MQEGPAVKKVLTRITAARKSAKAKQDENVTAGGPNRRKPVKPNNTSKEGKLPMSTDISSIQEIAGFIGACLIDSDTGLMIASQGGGSLDLEAAGALNTEVVRAKRTAIKTLGLNDVIEDILITLGKQYHLIRPLEANPAIFLYVALDRKVANLGMARVQVKKLESTLSL